VSERPLSADGIRELITEVADEHPADGPQRRLIIVGGALPAMHGLRERPATSTALSGHVDLTSRSGDDDASSSCR